MSQEMRFSVREINERNLLVVSKGMINLYSLARHRRAHRRRTGYQACKFDHRAASGQRMRVDWHRTRRTSAAGIRDAKSVLRSWQQLWVDL